MADNKPVFTKEQWLNYLRFTGHEDDIIRYNLDGVDINTQLERCHRKFIDQYQQKQKEKQFVQEQAQAIAKRVQEILNGKH